jgi:hypothetical protein
MATVSLTDLANVSMDAWVKRVTKLPNSKYWLYNNLPSMQVVNQSGEQIIYVPMQTQLPESAFMSKENAAHPTARAPAFVKGYLYLKKLIALMQFSEETIVLNQGANALVKSLENISNGTLEAYNMVREFQMHQNGTGVVATVVSATGDGTATHTVVFDSARWIRQGMVFDFYTGASANATNFQATDVNYDTNTVVFSDLDSGTHTIADGDVLYYAGTYVSGGTILTSMYANGIDTLINSTDTAFPGAALTMGFDRDTQSFAKAVVKTGASAGTAEALTLGRMRSVFDSIDINWGQDTPELIYTGIGGYNAYQEVLRNENQPIVSMPASGGYPDGLEFVYNGKKARLVSSRLVSDNYIGTATGNATMYFINPKHLIKYVGGSEGWDTIAGGFQKVAGYQQYQRVYRGWMNFGCDAFKSQGRLNDITPVV